MQKLIQRRRSPLANVLKGFENVRSLRIIGEKGHKPSKSLINNFNFLAQNTSANR